MCKLDFDVARQVEARMSWQTELVREWQTELLADRVGGRCGWRGRRACKRGGARL